MNFIYDNGCDSAILTTDDFRVSAVKSYLTAGFVPIFYSDIDDNMEQRWIDMLNILKISSTDAVDDNGVFVKTLTI